MDWGTWRQWREHWRAPAWLLASIIAKRVSDAMLADTPVMNAVYIWFVVVLAFLFYLPELHARRISLAGAGAIWLLTILAGLGGMVLYDGARPASHAGPPVAGTVLTPLSTATPAPTWTPPPATWTPVPTPTLPPLSSVQRRLLRLLMREQERLVAQKLIVGREGAIWGANGDLLDVPVDLVPELYGGRQAAPGEFAVLVESVPDVYLRQIPEARFDSPFVVVVTALGAREAGR